MSVQQHEARNILYVIMLKLRQPLVVLGVRENDVEPIGVLLLDLGHKIGQGFAELALGGVEFHHRRALSAHESCRESPLLRLLPIRFLLCRSRSVDEIGSQRRQALERFE